MHSLDHDKSSSISQLIYSKSEDLEKLIKYFNGTTIFDTVESFNGLGVLQYSTFIIILVLIHLMFHLFFLVE